GDFLLGAKHRLFEFQIDIFAKVRAPLRPIAPATASAAKKIAKAKELAEYIAEVVEYGGIEACACTRPANARVTETVIHPPLLHIGENSIGLTTFLELLFRVRFVRFPFRMELNRKLPIRTLILLTSAAPLHP